MADSPVYAVIAGKRVRLDRVSARISNSDRRERLKVILSRVQISEVINKAIDEAYVEVMNITRREQGLPVPAEPHVGPVTVNIGEKGAGITV